MCAIYMLQIIAFHALVTDSSDDVTQSVFPVGHLTAPLLKRAQLLGPCVHNPLNRHTNIRTHLEFC